MTTEIAILNKSAVALASDSAVTITATDPDGKRVTKIYVDANKLFELVRGRPVGVMIYNSAEVAGVPWETLIKQYREDRPTAHFETLEQHAEDFIAYAQDRLAESHDDSAELSHLMRAFHGMLETIYKQMGPHLLTEPNKIQRRRDLVDMLEAVEDQLSTTPILDWAIGLDEKALWRRWGADLVASMPTETDEVRFSARSKLRFAKIGLSALMRFPMTPGPWSGVVVAGFGARELFPSVTHVQVAGIVGGRLITLERDTDSISEDQPAIIQPYAQTSEAIMFLQGIDPSMSAAVSAFWSQWASEIGAKIGQIVRNESSVTAPHLAAIRRATETFMTTSWQRFADFMESEFHSKRLRPIEASAGFLSKREIADLAENLVELTSLRNRVSLDREETVGGATDVAVISKGDGFVWIKRKHYFGADRNPAWSVRQALSDVVGRLEVSRRSDEA